MRQFEGLKNMPGRCRWPSSWSSWCRFQWKSWWACLCCNCSCGTCKSSRSSRTRTQTSRCPKVLNYAVGKRRQRGQRLLNFNYFDNLDPKFCWWQLDQIQKLSLLLPQEPANHPSTWVCPWAAGVRSARWGECSCTLSTQSEPGHWAIRLFVRDLMRL